MSVNRRDVLKVIATAAAAVGAAALPAQARERKTAPAEAIGMLYDTTRCIGCKACVSACRAANELDGDRSGTPDGVHLVPVDLNGRTKNVIKLYKDDEQMSFFKAQCMHCIDPGCASACMLHSLHKNEKTGVVEYDVRWCVGCRYCQMACPFNVPKFEFDQVLPEDREVRAVRAPREGCGRRGRVRVSRATRAGRVRRAARCARGRP